MSTPREPRARDETHRQAILRWLEEAPLTARELSGLLHIREKDVIPHLEHLARSLRRSARPLEVTPAECLGCGYRFERRRRLHKPSSCPRCRGQRIESPVFALAE